MELLSAGPQRLVLFGDGRGGSGHSRKATKRGSNESDIKRWMGARASPPRGAERQQPQGPRAGGRDIERDTCGSAATTNGMRSSALLLKLLVCCPLLVDCCCGCCCVLAIGRIYRQQEIHRRETRVCIDRCHRVSVSDSHSRPHHQHHQHQYSRVELFITTTTREKRTKRPTQRPACRYCFFLLLLELSLELATI